MEMKKVRSSRHGIINDISETKSNYAMKAFDRYVQGLDTSSPNDQVLNQLSELHTMLLQIKTKEKKRMETIENKILEEAKEIETIRDRLRSVTKAKELPSTDEKDKFKVKYIMFCTTERKNISKLLGSADKTCNILKECYNHCEKKHKNDRDAMTKDLLMSQKPTNNETDDVSHLQKKYAAETSKNMLKSLKHKSSPTDTLYTIYTDLAKRFGEREIDMFFEKSFEICWTMVSDCNPMKFSFDKGIRIDNSDDQRVNIAERPDPMEYKKTSSMKKSEKNQKKSKPEKYAVKDTTEPDLELKYPAVFQGQRIVVNGLKQKKVPF